MLFSTPMRQKSVRLTTGVMPEKYEISLKPDLKAFIFEGEETIHLVLKKPSRSITLHCAEINIRSALLTTKTGDRTAHKISYDERAETATVSFKDPLPKGGVRLKLSFHGILNDKMRGFYRSSFMHEGKQLAFPADRVVVEKRINRVAGPVIG